MAAAAAGNTNAHEHIVALPRGWRGADYREKYEREAARKMGGEGQIGTLDNPWWKGEPARAWPFQLDDFQKQAMACLERQESVLVAAHTSAGKTVVAEYAIAKALRENGRVIYTSPLKALSNQKFRELCEAFNSETTQNVGILTGDVTLHADAPVLVMTTEILRSMQYKGNDSVMSTVRYVVYDEVHYMTDKERGVVWEETIIMMPASVRMVFLSATLANAPDFAQWIADVHSHPCHVITTSKRPTPLVHYGFPCIAGGGSGAKSPGGGRGGAPATPGATSPRGGGDGSVGLYLVVDEHGKFNDSSFDRLSAALATHHAATAPPPRPHSGDSSDRQPQQQRAGGKPASPKDLQRVMKLLHARELHPAIVFAFSRRECEHNALQVSKLDFLPGADAKAQVASIFDAALMSLPEEDRAFAPLATLKPLLQRGVGVHHSGLLPMVKEVVEILFQEGFIRVLFTTETFAMGLNMPARSVVFTSLMKFDGEKMRHVASGEYIQMSGRAGRRGVDSVGMVIFLATYDPPEKGDANAGLDKEVFKNIMLGKPKPLVSEFRLTYYTLLNLIRRSASGSGNASWSASGGASSGGKKRKRGEAASDALSYQEHIISLSFHAHQREVVCRKMRHEARKLTRRAHRIEVGEVDIDDSDVEDEDGGDEDESDDDVDVDVDDGEDENGAKPEDLEPPAPGTERSMRSGEAADGDGAPFSRACDVRDALLAKLRQAEDRCFKVLRKAANNNKSALLLESYLQTGRLVKVRQRERDAEVDWGWGVVLAVLHGDGASATSGPAAAADTIVDVLVEAAPVEGDSPAVPPRWRAALGADVGTARRGAASNAVEHVLPLPEATDLPSASDATASAMRAVRFPLTALVGVSVARLSLPRDLNPPHARHAVLMSLREMQRRFPQGLPRLHPVEDMHVSASSLVPIGKDKGKDKQRQAMVSTCASKHKEVVRLEKELGTNAAYQAAFDAFVAPAAARSQAPRAAGSSEPRAPALNPRALLSAAELRRRATRLREAAANSSLAAFRNELKARKRVLRALGHLEVRHEGGDDAGAAVEDDDAADAPGAFDVVTLKGQAACHVDIADELLTTELLFDGAFNALSVPQLCALCTCLLPETEKTEEQIKLRSELQDTLNMLHGAATRIAEVAFDCGVAPAEAEREDYVTKYVESFQPGLMDVAFEWSRGEKTFAEIADMTDMFEGSVVRSLRRLVELLDNLHSACVEVGESTLADKFDAARKSVARGIVYANSLYL